MDNIKYYGNVDTKEVLEELKGLEKIYPNLYRVNRESNHPDTKGILLKFPDLATYDLATTTSEKDMDSILQPGYYLFKTLPRLIDDIIKVVNGTELVWGFLLILAPGGKILPHEDTTQLPIEYKRIHVPLQTKEGNLLKTGDTEIYMKTGEVWWFNNRIIHSGINDSDIERIHLVLDIKGIK